MMRVKRVSHKAPQRGRQADRDGVSVCGREVGVVGISPKPWESHISGSREQRQPSL